MTLTSRSYFLRSTLAAAGLVVASLLTPGFATAYSGDISHPTPTPLEGKIPVCGGYSEVLGATIGQPTLHWIDVDACPGPPGNVSVISAVQTTTCGSSEMLTLDITDANGYNVKDGTAVTLTTSLGQVPATVSTRYGIASASFLARSEDAGRAEIVITSGFVQTTKVIDVTCA